MARLLFWKRLRLRGYPAKFLLPIFREISYSNRCKWFSKPRKVPTQGRVVFKTTFNCSHVGIKKVILKHLPHLSSIVNYKSTNTLAQLIKSWALKLNFTPFLRRIYVISCAYFCVCFAVHILTGTCFCTIPSCIKLVPFRHLVRIPDEVCLIRRNRSDNKQS